MELKGSKTEANLLTAFAGESQARNKYTYYAEKAREEGSARLPNYLKKQLQMKKNMQNCGLKLYTAMKSQIQLQT